MKKSTGNMYPWVTHTVSFLRGACPHKCSYCYVQAMAKRFPTMRARYSGKLALDLEELAEPLGSGRIIFIEHLNDLFAEAVPSEWIRAVLGYCSVFNNTYVFQTKNPSHLKQDFYSFKRRFLARFATPDDYDLQTILPTCWTCGGTGMFFQDECRKCGGTGIFSTEREIVLCRFDLCGRIYHIPAERGEPNPCDVTIREHYQGIIKHPRVDPAAGKRSYFRLLLRHEPNTFHSLAMLWLLRKGSNRWLFRLIRSRNSMDLFPCIDPIGVLK